LQDPALWDSAQSQRMTSLQKELAQIQATEGPLLKIKNGLSDLEALLELAESDFSSLQQDCTDAVQETDSLLAELEFQRMFDDPFDKGNAFLEIQSGSGGTEAQDWAEMLWRMYRRWIERKGFQYEILDYSAGEVAGMKGVYVKISGPYAYGLLRTESGVHRLVRKSPFDSGNRRHTSFAAVFITPELDDTITIQIDPSDLRVDTYRASGAGGQHVNRTDSAIRITHIPSGIVVQCQNDRSQHKNRAQAMKQLESKLYDLEQKKKNAQIEALSDAKTDITWGAQVRSYVLDDSRVKDLRTQYETSDTDKMLNGDLLDQFIKASLLHAQNQRITPS